MSLSNRITSVLGEHYENSFDKFGAVPKGVDWGCKEDVNLRYSKMLSVINEDKSSPKESFSILDVGCGYGGLKEYNDLYENRNIIYTGIDIAENMIEYAREKYKDVSFIQGSIFDLDDNERFDFVVCNGILTQKLSISIMEMDKFAHELIGKMFSICKIGIAFNIMTTKVDFMVDNLYYRNPIDMFAYCFNTVSHKIRIDHGYNLYEYTVYLYK